MEGQEECKFTGRQCFGWNSAISWGPKSNKTTPESAANTQGKLNKRDEVLQDHDFTTLRNLSLSWHCVTHSMKLTPRPRVFSQACHSCTFLIEVIVSLRWSRSVTTLTNNFILAVVMSSTGLFLPSSLSCNSFRNESNLGLLWHLVALANSTSTKHPDPYSQS